jgi:mannose-1-phosphate guanylyltransferase
MDAVVLAAGRGTRLLPLTATRPKPLVPFLNRPLMDYMMVKLQEMGVGRTFVLVDYLGEQIRSYYTRTNGMELIFSGDNEPLGTAGAVKKVVAEFDDTFIVVSGDVLTDLDLRLLRKAHGEGAPVTMALSTVVDPRQYGIAVLDGRQRIVRFLEKPKPEEVFSNLVNAGIYIFEPGVFDMIPPKASFDFSRDLFPLMLRKGIPIQGYPFRAYWNDIGRPTNYLAATADSVSGRFSNSLVPSVQVKEGGVAITGRNCHLGEGVEVNNFAILGDNVTVGAGSKLNSVVIFSNSTLGEGCKVGESIVGSDCVLEDRVQVRAGSVIGDACYIKAGAVLGHNTKLWYASRLTEGAVVNPD